MIKKKSQLSIHEKWYRTVQQIAPPESQFHLWIHHHQPFPQHLLHHLQFREASTWALVDKTQRVKIQEEVQDLVS